jgi:hypothetical protein
MRAKDVCHWLRPCEWEHAHTALAEPVAHNRLGPICPNHCSMSFAQSRGSRRPSSLFGLTQRRRDAGFCLSLSLCVRNDSANLGVYGDSRRRCATSRLACRVAISLPPPRESAKRDWLCDLTRRREDVKKSTLCVFAPLRENENLAAERVVCDFARNSATSKLTRRATPV